jgi:hypothetical protein
MPDVRSQRVARIAVFLTLVAWGAPITASLGVAVHLATHHHLHDGQATAMALAMAHGHHHDLDVPEHRHQATTPDASPSLAAASTGVDAAAALPAVPGLRDWVPILVLHPTHSPPSPSLPAPLRL